MYEIRQIVISSKFPCDCIGLSVNLHKLPGSCHVYESFGPRSMVACLKQGAPYLKRHITGLDSCFKVSKRASTDVYYLGSRPTVNMGLFPGADPGF